MKILSLYKKGWFAIEAYLHKQIHLICDRHRFTPRFPEQLADNNICAGWTVAGPGDFFRVTSRVEDRVNVVDAPGNISTARTMKFYF